MERSLLLLFLKMLLALRNAVIFVVLNLGVIFMFLIGPWPVDEYFSYGCDFDEDVLGRCIGNFLINALLAAITVILVNNFYLELNESLGLFLLSLFSYLFYLVLGWIVYFFMALPNIVRSIERKMEKRKEEELQEVERRGPNNHIREDSEERDNE